MMCFYAIIINDKNLYFRKGTIEMNTKIFRGVFAILGLLVYIAFTIFIFWITGKHLALIFPNIEIDTIIYRIFGVIIVLLLIKTTKNYSYAVPWIIIVMLFPIVGTILYYVLREQQEKEFVTK